MYGVCVGNEAADEEDLKVHRKIATVEDNFKVVDMFQKYNINILPGFITFNLYSSFKELKKNIDFLESYEFASSMEIVTNQYGVYIWCYLQKRIEKDGLLKSSQTSMMNMDTNFVYAKIEQLINFMHKYIDSVHKAIPFAFETVTNQ